MLITLSCFVLEYLEPFPPPCAAVVSLPGPFPGMRDRAATFGWDVGRMCSTKMAAGEINRSLLYATCSNVAQCNHRCNVGSLPYLQVQCFQASQSVFEPHKMSCTVPCVSRSAWDAAWSLASMSSAFCFNDVSS